MSRESLINAQQRSHLLELHRSRRNKQLHPHIHIHPGLHSELLPSADGFAPVHADMYTYLCIRPHIHVQATRTAPYTTPYVHLLILITNSNTARLAPTKTAACRALQVRDV